MATPQVPTPCVLNNKLFARLRALKKNNCHGEAYVEAAQALGLTELRDQFARIDRDLVREGHLSFELNQERHAAYNKLMQEAKRRFPGALYDRFYMCF